MTAIYYDTEFLEDGRTIELISIGLVSERGDEYYAVNRNMPLKKITKNHWLMAHVWPSLPQPHGDARNFGLWPRLDTSDPVVKLKSQIANEVRQFILSHPDPQLWAWYGAYDHVALAQLFGRMIDLPTGIPMWTNDLQQEAQRLGDPRLPEQAAGLHNALEDARHNRLIAQTLADAARRR